MSSDARMLVLAICFLLATAGLWLRINEVAKQADEALRHACIAQHQLDGKWMEDCP